MTADELIAHLEQQITARGLDPLSDEEIYTLESGEGAERDGLLEDLRDRVGLNIPDDAFSCVDDDERSNGPRR